MSIGRATHWKGPLLGADNARGGLFEDLPVNELSRVHSNYKVYFEDFASTPIADGELGDAGTNSGAVVTAINTPTSPTETVDPANGYLLINPGTGNDSGSEVQFTGAVSQTTGLTPIIRTPGSITSTATLMDNRELIWACRFGVQCDTTAWDGKVVMGWITIDTSLMNSANGDLTIAAGGGAGFHIAENGNLGYFGTNAAVTAVDTTLTTPNFATLDAAATFQWNEVGFRIKWIDASAGTGSIKYYVNGVHVGSITSALPMDDTEVYATTFGIHNGPARDNDLAVDWVLTAISRPGVTTSTDVS